MNVGDPARGGLVGALPSERGAVVPAPGILATVQRRGVVGPGAHAPSLGPSALGPPPLDAGEVESAGCRRAVPRRHAQPLQGHDGRSRRVRLHEGYHSLSSRYDDA